ncbi:MAG: OprD family outer membrane porin, partial [Sulfuricurvum sp.]|nr:OprD family outer membrane porin [Sulfuricurvum sp.]
MKKAVGMSLAAAVLLGASAFAIDNVKVSGDAKLYYYTDDKNSGDLFNKTTSAADTAIRVGATGDLAKNISFGLTGYGISTLGLENNLVSNTWSSAHTVTNGSVSDEAWIGEAWIAATYGKTTFKAGRMLLDSPLSFSETWSIVPNIYEAFVLINQDIPDTTVVGVYAGHSNGVNAVYLDNVSGVGIDHIVGSNGAFGIHGANGANVAGIINNSFKPLSAQAWYWNVVDAADAYWLQADVDFPMLKGLKLGVQYADISPKTMLAGVHDSTAYALKVGYEGIENLKLSAAFSDAGKDNVLKVSNLATDNRSSQSKLYTEA